MIYIDIDGEVPRSELQLGGNMLFDVKQLAAHIRRNPALKKALIGSLVWSELLSRGEVREDEERAQGVLDVALEEADQLTEVLTDAVYT